MRESSVAPTIFNDREIAQASPSLSEIIDIVENTYRQDGSGAVEVPRKIGVHPDFENSFLHAMPAWVPDQRALGMKWVSYFPGSDKGGAPDSTGIIILNDPDIGLPVAIMEGMWITYARTTACAIVMARHLLARSPEVVTLIGCGGLGRWSVMMLHEVFPDIREIRVTSRNAARRQDFCAEMSGRMHWPVVSCDTVQEAVEPADLILSSIAPPPSPFVEPDWMKHSALAVAMDYFHCYTPGAVRKFDRFVTDDVSPIRERVRQIVGGDPGAEVLSFSKLLVEGGIPPASGPVLAIPTGVASVDMTVSWEIYRRAREMGLGTEVRLTA